MVSLWSIEFARVENILYVNAPLYYVLQAASVYNRVKIRVIKKGYMTRSTHAYEMWLYHSKICIDYKLVNSLRPSDAYMRQ